MPSLPPMPNILHRDLEILMDAYAYLLQNDSRTSGVAWILGEPGMGRPSRIPFAYIHPQTEAVTWYTAQGGGSGGLAAGLDDWMIPVVMTIATEKHQFKPPVAAAPSDSNPFAPANLGAQVNYLEQPGWRQSLQITQAVKKVLRTNVVIGGAATDTRIVESRYLLMDIGNELHRVTRITVQTQQRRVRGD